MENISSFVRDSTLSVRTCSLCAGVGCQSGVGDLDEAHSQTGGVADLNLRKLMPIGSPLL